MATNKAEQPELPLYKGSCHCKHTQYTVRLDLINIEPELQAHVTKCNCSICLKAGYIEAHAKPATSFTLVSPAEGRDGLTDYQFGDKKYHHRSCPKCGVSCFLEGVTPIDGKDFYGLVININTLDERADRKPLEDFRKLKIAYWDGRGDGWEKGTAKEPWEGGVW